jgi:hypothetical protein
MGGIWPCDTGRSTASIAQFPAVRHDVARPDTTAANTSVGATWPRPSTRRHAARQYQVRPDAILLINWDGYLRYATQQDRISSVGRIMDCAHPHVVVTGASSGIGRRPRCG